MRVLTSHREAPAIAPGFSFFRDHFSGVGRGLRISVVGLDITGFGSGLRFCRIPLSSWTMAKSSFSRTSRGPSGGAIRPTMLGFSICMFTHTWYNRHVWLELGVQGAWRSGKSLSCEYRELTRPKAYCKSLILRLANLSKL